MQNECVLDRVKYPLHMRTFIASIALAVTCVVSIADDAPPPGTADFSMSRFVPGRRAAQSEFEKKLLESIDPKRLSAWHDLVASEPHVAGTPGDLRQIDRLAKAFAEMGLEVETHWIWPYLCKPVSAEVEIVAPASAAKKLGVSEPPIDSDKYTRSPDLIPLAWNAYSGSGDATANVVYCNYGTKADFEKLKELGVETRGTIALARYGGNFRGYKAKFAQDAGCVGLIIFIDPADSGYAKGPAYPEGGWATPTQVQCGSILTTAWAGDPLTPMIEATENAPRVTPEEAGLPKIPVQPIGWESAQPILKAMTGEPVADRVPEWQGGLPTPYRLTGGAELKVRLKVEQTRAITKTANVVATLKGAKEPEKKIIIGCHHDAWNHGACDPTCGLILVLEVAKVMSDLAKAGHPPDRSILFCGWGAEEFGILGSVEWVEKNLADLEKNGVAYINLDMATMGANFSASSAPSLRSLIYDAARIVPNAPLPPGPGGGVSMRRPAKDAAPPVSPGSVFDTWLARTKPATPAAPATPATAPPSSTKAGTSPESNKLLVTPEPPIGDLGGGSDHIGFVCHALVPSISLGSGGSRGTSYHSIYDTLDWYRAVVGDDYLPAQMNARMTAVIAARLANADVLPMDPRRVAPDLTRQMVRLEQKATAMGLRFEPASLATPLESLESNAKWVHERVEKAVSAHDGEMLFHFNTALMSADRSWQIRDGLPGRKWFRNSYAASDRDSGYAPWILPMLEQAIEDRNQKALDDAIAEYQRLISRAPVVVFDVKPK
jgi:N-acetylated-alpha-linked acidic dipeptidase